MTREDIDTLLQPTAIQFLADHLEMDPSQVALDNKDTNFPISLLATQLKYLQRAKKKLPAYYKARCILPPRAYEQSSSEQAASMKTYRGTRVLDLTCGLGVDSFQFSQHFQEVISLEPDPLLSTVTTHNFNQLGCKNVQVIPQTAQEFLQNYSGPRFDLMYVDPDRRDAQGNRKIRLEDCSPDVLALLPLIQRHTKQLVIKASPLFDVTEAYRIFPGLRKISVVSIENECKEVLIDISFEEKKDEPAPVLEIMLYREGRQKSFMYPIGEPMKDAQPFEVPETPFYLFEPDVAFYKANCTEELFQKSFPELRVQSNHAMGFFLSSNLPASDFPGRIFRIENTSPFKPKILKKKFSKTPVNLIKRHFSLSIKKIRQQTGIQEGGDDFLLFTEWGNKKWTLKGKPWKSV